MAPDTIQTSVKGIMPLSILYPRSKWRNVSTGKVPRFALWLLIAIEKTRSNNQINKNPRGNSRFDRNEIKTSYRNRKNPLGNRNHTKVGVEEPISYSESFTKTLSDDLIWGRHSTEAALLGGRAIHRIWCTSELRSSPKFFQLLKDSKASGV